MSKLSPFLEGVISAFLVGAPQPIYRTHDANTGIPKTSGVAQDWQTIGRDISAASNKVGQTVGVMYYEPKTT